MSELSPAAEAVLDAALPHIVHRYSIAAALRAAADQVVPEGGSRRNNEIRSEFLSIAEELEAQ